MSHARCASLDDAVRALVLCVVILVFMGAADPTPRFLGLPRGPHEGHVVPGRRAGAGPVLPRFDLPTCEAVRGEGDTTLTPAERVLVATPPRSPLLATHVFLAVAVRVDAGRDRCDRNRSGPPLRC